MTKFWDQKTKMPSKGLQVLLRTSESRCGSTDLPGQAVPSVPVHLPLTDSSDQHTLFPPQLLAVFDDVVPQPAGLRCAAQAYSVQLTKDLHAHLCRQLFSKVLRWGGSERVETQGRRVVLHCHHDPTTAWEENEERGEERGRGGKEGERKTEEGGGGIQSTYKVHIMELTANWAKQQHTRAWCKSLKEPATTITCFGLFLTYLTDFYANTISLLSDAFRPDLI